jgi:hypothetical protein
MITKLLNRLTILILLATTANAGHFSMFDTIWVNRNIYQEISDISHNDSLFIAQSEVRRTIDGSYAGSLGSFYNSDSPPVFITDGKEILNSFCTNDSTICVMVFDSKTVDQKDFFNLKNFPEPVKFYSEIDSCYYHFSKGKTYKIHRFSQNVEVDSIVMKYWYGTLSRDGEYIAGSFMTSEPDSIYFRKKQYVEVRVVKTGELIFSKIILNFRSVNKMDTLDKSRMPVLTFSPDNLFILINRDIYSLVSSEKILQYVKYEDVDSMQYSRTSPIFMKESGKVFGAIDHKKAEGTNYKIVAIGYSVLDLNTLEEKIIFVNFQKDFLVPSIIRFVFDDETLLTGSLGKKVVNDRGFEYIGGASLLHFDKNFTSIKEISEESDIFISPNPATDYITLNIPPLEKRGIGGVLQEIQIFDIIGNCALNVGAIHEFPLRIDISSLPAGVYFVRIGEKMCKFVKINN